MPFWEKFWQQWLLAILENLFRLFDHPFGLDHEIKLIPIKGSRANGFENMPTNL
jgi:hypothetical protein